MNLVLGENRLGAWIVSECLQESLVNGIDTLLLAGGSETGSQHEIIGLNTWNSEGLGERELVLGQSTGLIRAKNFDTSQGLNGRKLLDDSLLLSKISSTDSHGGCDDSWKTDGDTNDGNGQGILENLTIGLDR
jgi:hypothetical protein